MKSVKAINHIGIAVRSIDAQRPFYEETLGAVYEGTEEVADQKVRVGFFRVGDVRLELLEPSEPRAPSRRSSTRKGRGCITSPTPSRISRPGSPSSSRRGVRMIDESARARVLHHTRIAFVHPKSSCNVLTELCEPVTGHGPASS